MVCCIWEQGFLSPNCCTVTPEMSFCLNEFSQSPNCVEELSTQIKDFLNSCVTCISYVLLKGTKN